ncbi:HAMP domain-containing sensor histidine kinase [Clostridium sp. BNL1100]|uniref:sensor histidine kinase n=1 Tax=Clostridium sp. BNL1100 TaxID=755731 RepID=UPI00024A799B|nr:HAMP domain-containing sensor histidine kinase [Clostridium sp. BNL1100]AEY67423.1 signal transduction histidine kinase [Clostridium sp. BNL1100]
MLWLIIIVLILVIVVLSAYIFLYKRQIREIASRLQFIRYNVTNMKINLQLKTKETNELATQLNYIIDYYKTEKAAISKAQHEFKEEITNISHDLRTPLTSISGYVQMLESEKTPAKKKSEYYSVIRGRINTLVKMLDDFFEFTRTESEEYKIQLKKTNVSNVLTDVIALFYYDFLSKGEEPSIRIPSKPIYIPADKDALKRVFQNLIKNYLNHGTGGISILVKQEGTQVIISFRNYVPNLDSLDVDNLFKRFYTADKSRTKKTTGLGLAIVKNLVAKMKGEIEAYVEDSFLIIDITFKI